MIGTLISIIATPTSPLLEFFESTGFIDQLEMSVPFTCTCLQFGAEEFGEIRVKRL